MIRFGTSAARRSIVAGLALAAGMVSSAYAAAEVTFKATYAISISGVGVGRADAEGRFIGNNYAAAISGTTSGASRLVSDATAKLAGNGRLYGARILPTSYNLKTLENGFATSVRMAMASGRITSVVAEPGLAEARDRIPITARHKTNVVDPLAAFMVPLDRPGVPNGKRACDRTIHIFDGWTRYDIRLYYKDTRAVDGTEENFAGRVIVCGARYVPIAGHRSARKAVQSMADNDRLEVWLAVVEEMPVLVPYRIMIGTELGDLVVHATRFKVEKRERHADAK